MASPGDVYKKGASGFPVKQDSEIAPRRRPSTSLRTGSRRGVKRSWLKNSPIYANSVPLR
jgi:hypothetical protein